jgi:hypothetical protein
MDNKEPENKDNINTIENQPKKRGRPKKYDFAGLSKEDYDKKWYEINKEKLQEKFKQNYIENKDEMKEKSKEHQNKYRDSYKLLIDLYNNNEINTSNDKIEKIKKIIFQ